MTAEPLSMTAPALPSNRTFGLFFAAVFAVLGFARAPWFFVAAVCLGLALGAPALLKPFNWIWFQLGMLLGRLTTPVVMAVLFIFVVTPTGFLARCLGKDPLRRKWDEKAESYWQPRTSGPGVMRNQF